MYNKLSDKDFFIPFFDNLSGDERIRHAIEAGKGVDDVSAIWEDEVQDYLVMREKYLLYPD